MARSIRPEVPLEQLTRDEVLYLQNLLRRYGYDPGPIDGIMGPATRGAYLRFSQENNNGRLPWTGAAVSSSLVSLLSDSEQGPMMEGSVVRGRATGLTGSVAQPAPAAAPEPLPETTAVAPTPPAPSVVTTTSNVEPTPEIIATDAEADAEIYKRYPMMAPYLNHPEVGPLLRWAAREGMSDGELEARLHSTWWWKLTDSKIRQWDRLYTDDPAEAARLMKVKGQEIYTGALRAGVPMNEADAEYLAGRVLREGWSDVQLNRFYGALVRNVGYNAGAITENQAKLRKTAAAYLTPVRDEDLREWSTRILEGTATLDTFNETMRTDAMNRFHWMKDQIANGATPDDLFRGLKNTVATTLDLDPQSINLNDPRWADLVSPIGGGKDGRSMTYSEARQWARNRPEWATTDDANQQASSLNRSLLKAMGVMG